jgi:hypothetical protein
MTGMLKDGRSLVVAVVAFGILAIGLAGAVPSGAGASGTLATAAKKKCAKKGAAAAKKKKCKKKRSGGAPAATGPELAAGNYTCTYGSFQVQPGRQYTVNNGNPGTYTYDPATGIVNFQGGSYADFFGKYYADKKAIDLFANKADPPYVAVGDFLWGCGQ